MGVKKRRRRKKRSLRKIIPQRSLKKGIPLDVGRREVRREVRRGRRVYAVMHQVNYLAVNRVKFQLFLVMYQLLVVTHQANKHSVVSECHSILHFLLPFYFCRGIYISNYLFL